MRDERELACELVSALVSDDVDGREPMATVTAHNAFGADESIAVLAEELVECRVRIAVDCTTVRELVALGHGIGVVIASMLCAHCRLALRAEVERRLFAVVPHAALLIL